MWTAAPKSFETECGRYSARRIPPRSKQVARLQLFGRAVRSSWGTGEAMQQLLPSVGATQLLGMMERMSASPGMARATYEATFRTDVLPVLGAIAVPTLVIHAKDDLVPVQGGRFLADHIPGARFLEVEGSDHTPWISDPDRIVAGIEEFLTGTRGARRRHIALADGAIQRHGCFN